MQLQHLAANDCAIHVAAGIHTEALCAAVLVGGRLLVFDERRHGSGFCAADADAFFHAWLIGAPGFRIGDVDGVIASDVNAAGTAELFPLGEKFPVLVENLDAVVYAIADEQAALRVERDGVRLMKLAGTRSFAPPGLDEFSVLRKFDDAIVAGFAMAIGDEDVAIGRDYDVRGLVECVWPFP